MYNVTTLANTAPRNTKEIGNTKSSHHNRNCFSFFLLSFVFTVSI